MNEQDFISFLSVLGEEFCDTLSPIVGDEEVVPQDGYDVFYQTFKQEPSPTMLALLTETELEQLRTSCEEYLECEGITIAHMRSVVKQTLARWPAVMPSGTT